MNRLGSTNFMLSPGPPSLRLPYQGSEFSSALYSNISLSEAEKKKTVKNTKAKNWRDQFQGFFYKQNLLGEENKRLKCLNNSLLQCCGADPIFTAPVFFWPAPAPIK